MTEKKNILKYMILSGIGAVVIFLTAFYISGMLPGQKYYFHYGDGLGQILPYARLFWRNIIEGGSVHYSFETGLGMPMSAVYAFDVMSPFYVLLCFIPDVEVAAIVIVSAKLMCIAMSMCLFLKTTVKTDSYTAVIFSIAYGLGSFFCSFYFAFFMLDMLYVLPLMVMAIRRFVKTGKWGILCVIYAYSFVVQFYCAYMTGIFSAVIFVTYAWFCYGRTFVLWRKALIKFFLCVLAAALIAAPILLPAGYELFTLYASDTLKLDEFSLMPWSFLYGFYPGYLGTLQGNDNTAPLMYTGIPSVLLSTLFFADKANNVREKILAAVPMVFLILCSFIKPLYLFMHAFDAPNFYAFRFSWMMSFMSVALAAREMKNLRSGNVGKRYLWLAATGWSLGYFLIFFLEKAFNTPESGTLSLFKGCLIIAITVIYAILLSGCHIDKWKVTVMGGVFVVELLVNLLCGQAHEQDTMAERSLYTIADGRVKEDMIRVKNAEADDPWEFYRIRYLNSLTDNISALYGFRGLGWSCSVENEKVRNVLEKYGYATKNLMVNDYGSTPFMQMVFAQKYDIEHSYNIETNDKKTVFRKNEFTLPLGFMVSPDIKAYETPEGSPFDAQNAFASALCGEKHDIYTMHEGNCYVEPVNVEISQYEIGTKVRRTAEEGTLVYSFQPEQDGDIYAYMRRWGSTLYTKEAPLIYSDRDIGGMTNLSRVCMPHIIPIGVDDDGLCRLYLYMNRDSVQAFDYEAIYFAYENRGEIEAVYNELLPGAMEVTSFRDDRIGANINVGSEKTVLMTSIPWNEGWDIYVDGVRTESLALVDGAFLGAELEKGEHRLLFVYKQRWFAYGIVCMFLGIFLLVLCNARNKKNIA